MLKLYIYNSCIFSYHLFYFFSYVCQNVILEISASRFLWFMFFYAGFYCSCWNDLLLSGSVKLTMNSSDALEWISFCFCQIKLASDWIKCEQLRITLNNSKRFPEAAWDQWLIMVLALLLLKILPSSIREWPLPRIPSVSYRTSVSQLHQLLLPQGLRTIQSPKMISNSKVLSLTSP